MRVQEGDGFSCTCFLNSMFEEFENDLLEAALSYYDSGRPVIPCREDKSPYSNFSWSEYFTRAQTEEEVRQFFSNGAPCIAKVLFPACQDVHLDFDGPHAKHAWRQTGIVLPFTSRFFSQTPGNFQLIFTASDFLKKAGGLNTAKRSVRLVEADCNCSKVCGVDLLFNGYSLVPPSPGYTEDANFPLESVVEIPDAIIELAIRKQSEKRSSSNGSNGNGKIKAGKRNVTLTSLAGVWRRQGLEFDEILEKLLEKNQARCEPPLGEREIESIARSVCRYEPESSVEVVQNLTDLGNSKRFAALHAGNVLYSAERRKWVCWNGRFWEWDVTGAVQDLAERVIRSIDVEASQAEDKTARDELRKHASKTESRGKIENMLALAQALPEIRTTLARFDTHPFLFNVANGTLDLSAGTFREFFRDDYLTKVSPTTFDPTAECPRFMEFLSAITAGREDLAAYLQRAAGYSLTGSIKEQCLFILLGPGANGKTTFINTLVRVLGNYAYAKQIKTEVFFDAKGDSTKEYHLADLAGIRLSAATEGGKQRSLAAALAKQSTGGEQLIGRRPFEMPFAYWPEFKLWFGTNHQPRVNDTSEGMWRRLQPIPFDAVFPAETRIKGYEEKLIEEASGILNWMIKGCGEWQRIGLEPPDCVLELAQEYREQEDIVGRFIADECRTGRDLWEASGILYTAYCGWCEKNGEKPENTTSFGRALSEKGYKGNNAAGGVRKRFGLALKAKANENE